MTPRILGGRYEVTRLLRAGPVTDVYEGFDQQRRQHVIIEVLPAGMSSDATSVALFTKAFESASRLDHPGIVPVGKATMVRDLHFAVRDAMGGPSLREYLAEHGPPRPARAAVIAAALSEALSYAHMQGVVHGGISPADILLAEDGDVKLSGFGLAASTVYDMDARYAAPERSEHHLADPRSDLYALGCCLYEMLVGRPPFQGDTPVALTEQHAHREPKFPEGAGAGGSVPAELIAVVRRLLAKRPDDRYQEALEVVQDLQSYLATDAKAGSPAVTPAGVPIVPSGHAAPGPEDPSGTTAAGGHDAHDAHEVAGTGGEEANVIEIDVPGRGVLKLPGPRPGKALVPVPVPPDDEAEGPAAGLLSSRRTVALLAAAACLPFVVGGLVAVRWSDRSGGETPGGGEQAAAVSDLPSRTTAEEARTTSSSSTTSTTKPPPETTTTSTTTTTTAPETTTTRPSVTGPGRPSGPPASPTTTGTRVPEVVGMRQGFAEWTLRNAGFQVDVRTTWTRMRTRDGRVESQQPGAGQTRPRGSTVTITVWRDW